MTIPVTLEEAKRQLRQGGEALDAEREEEIAGFIVRAAGWVERYTGHILTVRDVTEEFVGFDRINLTAWPVKSGAVPTVSYAPALGQSIAVSGARIVAPRRPARVSAAIGSRWPAIPGGALVTITVRAGYEDGDAVPADFKAAMLVLIGAYDADREGGEVFQKAETTARVLCGPYRLRSL